MPKLFRKGTENLIPVARGSAHISPIYPSHSQISQAYSQKVSLSSYDTPVSGQNCQKVAAAHYACHTFVVHLPHICYTPATHLPRTCNTPATKLWHTSFIQYHNIIHVNPYLYQPLLIYIYRRPINRSVYLSLSLSIYIPTNRSKSIYLSIYLSICLSIYLSIYISI